MPALASKQLAYKIASSFWWNLAIFFSKSLWISWVPQIILPEDTPAPYLSKASLHALIISGWLLIIIIN